MAACLVITSFERGFHNYRDGIDKELRGIFDGLFETIDEREDLEALTPEVLSAYEMIVVYSPAAGALRGEDPFARALAAYLIRGGSILHIHFACFGSFTEGAQMLGGAFRLHPPYREYLFVPAGDALGWLPETAFDGAFTLRDEAHLTFTEGLLEREILLYAVNDDHRVYDCGVNPHQDIYAQSSGIRVPLAWRYSYGKGKMLYCCPGHNEESFRHPMLRQFYRQAAGWLLH